MEQIDFDFMIVMLFALSTLLLLGFIFLEVINNDELIEIKNEYHKTQMLNFCKLSELKFKETHPELFPCEKWVGE